MSRAQLARGTGLSEASISRAVSGLIAAGLLAERDGPATGDGSPVRGAAATGPRPAVGRPGKVLVPADGAADVAGMVVGARTCELVAAGLDGTPRAGAKVTFRMPARYATLLGSVAEGVDRLSSALGRRVRGLGVSVPGLLDVREGRTLFSPNVHQMDGRTPEADLAARLGLPVAVVQESHALCLAERTFGAARNLDDFAMLDISEGLGLGIMDDGRILTGAAGLAGELGHITVELDGRPCGCGNRGCLETVATDTALARAVSERLGRSLGIEELVPAVASGELRADAEIERTLQYLAVAAAAVINVFNPARLFVHGRFLDAGPGLFERLLGLIRSRALAPSLAMCSIVRAKGSKLAGALAAIIGRLTAGTGSAASPTSGAARPAGV